MSDFLKLNATNGKTNPANPTNEIGQDNVLFVRSSEIVVMGRDSDETTFLFTKGIEKPLQIMQTPDAILAMMKDDNASLTMRQVLEHQMAKSA